MNCLGVEPRGTRLEPPPVEAIIEQLDLEGVPRVLETLSQLTTAESTGRAQKPNPLHSDTPLRFEFLALSEGADDPVEFFYGDDEHLDTLEKRLRSIYPETFDIGRVDVAARLIQTVEFAAQEFVEHDEAERPQYEFGPAEQYDPVDADLVTPVPEDRVLVHEPIDARRGT